MIPRGEMISYIAVPVIAANDSPLIDSAVAVSESENAVRFNYGGNALTIVLFSSFKGKLFPIAINGPHSVTSSLSSSSNSDI